MNKFIAVRRSALNKPGSHLLQAELCVLASDVAHTEWTYSADSKPSEPNELIIYETTTYLVSDGHTVGTCCWQRGAAFGESWAEWSIYGDIEPDKIIAWMALPLPALPRT